MYKEKPCKLIRGGIIPKEELDRVFNEAEMADMDYTYLCFEDEYFDVANHTDKDMTILDLGCAFAPQSYIFKDYAKYIGVDISFDSGAFFNRSKNSEFYEMDIMDFLEKESLQT